jgi:hypothetical protein
MSGGPKAAAIVPRRRRSRARDGEPITDDSRPSRERAHGGMEMAKRLSKRSLLICDLIGGLAGAAIAVAILVALVS